MRFNFLIETPRIDRLIMVLMMSKKESRTFWIYSVSGVNLSDKKGFSGTVDGFLDFHWLRSILFCKSLFLIFSEEKLPLLRRTDL